MRRRVRWRRCAQLPPALRSPLQSRPSSSFHRASSGSCSDWGRRRLSFYLDGREEWGAAELVRIGNQLSVFGAGSKPTPTVTPDDVAWAAEHVNVKTMNAVADDMEAMIASLRFIRIATHFTSWLLPTLPEEAANDSKISPIQPIGDRQNVVWYPSPPKYTKTLSVFTHPELVPAPHNTYTLDGSHLLNLIEYLDMHDLEAFGFNTLIDMKTNRFSSYSKQSVPSFTQWSSIRDSEAAMHAMLKVYENDEDSENMQQVRMAAAAAFLDSEVKIWALVHNTEENKFFCTKNGDLCAFLAPDVGYSFCFTQDDGQRTSSDFEYKPVRLMPPVGKLYADIAKQGRSIRIHFRESRPGKFESFDLSSNSGHKAGKYM